LSIDIAARMGKLAQIEIMDEVLPKLPPSHNVPTNKKIAL
jgi:hypothetical protein